MNTSKLRETANLKRGINSHAKKTFSKLIKELGDTSISLADIANGDKQPGFISLLDASDATLDELLVLQQYAKAITMMDTKAAEFIRDTAGQKPTQSIDLNSTSTSGLSQLTLEELQSLADDLHRLATPSDDSADNSDTRGDTNSNN